MTIATAGRVGRTGRFLLISMLATMAFRAEPAAAQTALPCDSPVPGSIASSLQRDLYTMTAGAGERVRADAGRTGGDEAFVAYWRLLDANGLTVVDPVTNRYCGNYSGYVVECTLGAAGTYRAEVSNGGGAAIGMYELWLTRLSAPCESLTLACEEAPSHGLTQGVSDEFDRDLFAFSTTDGERVRVDAARTGGDEAFVAYWRLLDANGLTVVDPVTNRYCGNYSGYVVECTLGAAGTYRAEVSNGGGAAIGMYELWLTRLSAPCESLTLACEEAPSHGLTQGVSDQFDRDLFAFSATDGERVRVDAARTGGDEAFVAYWRLLDANGLTVVDPVTNRYCGNYPGYVVECTLGAGTYRAEVSNGGGTAIGTYELVLTPLNVSCVTTTTTPTTTTTSTSGGGTTTTTSSTSIPSTTTTSTSTTTTSTTRPTTTTTSSTTTTKPTTTTTTPPPPPTKIPLGRFTATCRSRTS